MNIRLSSVRAVADRLESSGIAYASGGSGLLCSLGLADKVNDWDFTTEASQEELTAALQDFSCIVAPSGDYPFASECRLSIPDSAPPFDIIGRFAVHSDSGVVRLPVLTSAVWHGIRIGSPEVWAVAYALMGRQSKAALLLAYLREHGADREALRLLLEEPLPDRIRAELERLRLRPDAPR
ncbi:hypothetical protein N0M98_31190 [Paenibacillus doosanensis]|uniref:Uncharacterized protein n=1 Tax=Paenibacillus konkukensis TaxID=2020716 RepID=A0ABY4RSC5_9BACL|nr:MULTISPECIES: hypothetical protein [Paenibacillus]MCS7464564.1 hypothetical protein [Paenibacillus doosanensis]UQZ84850.1 hypothetical protein SK3146_04105 [Paenibacillus konkukensis]